MAQSAGSISALTSFGRAWLLALAAASIAAVGANLVLHVPLSSVVDVLLALVIFSIAILEVYFAIRAVGLLVTGRMSEAMLWLGAMVVYVLLLSPPLLAFTAYAWLTGQTLAGGSAIYDSVVGGFEAVFKLPAQLISATLVLILNSGSAYVNYVKQAKVGLEIAANLLSVVVALQTLRMHRDKHE